MSRATRLLLPTRRNRNHGAACFSDRRPGRESRLDFAAFPDTFPRHEASDSVWLCSLGGLSPRACGRCVAPADSAGRSKTSAAGSATTAPGCANAHFKESTRPGQRGAQNARGGPADSGIGRPRPGKFRRNRYCGRLAGSVRDCRVLVYARCGFHVQNQRGQHRHVFGCRCGPLPTDSKPSLPGRRCRSAGPFATRTKLLMMRQAALGQTRTGWFRVMQAGLAWRDRPSETAARVAESPGSAKP